MFICSMCGKDISAHSGYFEIRWTKPNEINFNYVVDRTCGKCWTIMVNCRSSDPPLIVLSYEWVLFS